MLYRKVSMLVGVLALGLYLAGSGLQAQENKTTQQRPGSATGGTSATAQAHGWSGRIANIDSTKHEINLENVHRWNPPNTTGTKTTGTGTGAASGTSNPAARTGSGSATEGTSAKKTMTFKVSPTAKITLDGKTATLSQLKSGQYARVSSRPAESKTGSGTSGTVTGTTPSGTKGTPTGTGSGAAGKTVHTVNWIEAFTKEPASTGTRSGAIK